MKNNKKVMAVVIGYFNCLIANDAEAVMKFCAKSWQNDEGRKWLGHYLYMFNDLIETSIVEVLYKNDNFAQVRVLTDDGVEEREYSINVLREKEAYLLDKTGEWGVNPVSLKMLYH